MLVRGALPRSLSGVLLNCEGPGGVSATFLASGVCVRVCFLVVVYMCQISTFWV